MKTNTHVILAVLGLAVAVPANAQVLMLDFGPTTVEAPSLTNSPYHTVDPLFTDTSWNKIETASVSSLLWSDGDAATGLALDVGGRSTAGGTTISLATTPSSNALGSTVVAGVYAGTSVGTDGIFVGSSGGQDRAVGFQLGGLTAGLYDIYVTARNTSTNVAYTQTVYLGTSLSSGNFDYSGFGSETLTYTGGATAATAAWVEGSNYLKFTIALDADEYLNLAVTGVGGTNEFRGFLNSVQIVSAIPEPAIYGVAASGFLTLLIAVRRRRRRPVG